MTTSPLIVRAVDQVGVLLDAVGPDDAGRATPCSEWTVADLADHLVHSTAGMATMARGGEVDWSAPVAHQQDPAAAFRATAADLVAALDPVPDGFPLGMAAGELAVHGWDLATALGRDSADLDPEVAEAGLGFMSGALTDEQRAGAFGPEQPAPDGADAYQRLAAFAGRTV